MASWTSAQMCTRCSGADSGANAGTIWGGAATGLLALVGLTKLMECCISFLMARALRTTGPRYLLNNSVLGLSMRDTVRHAGVCERIQVCEKTVEEVSLEPKVHVVEDITQRWSSPWRAAGPVSVATVPVAVVQPQVGGEVHLRPPLAVPAQQRPLVDGMNKLSTWAHCRVYGQQ